MYCTRKVAEDIYWIGGSDRRLALFENLFPIPRGVAYNSYLIMDEKTVVMDTVDASITRQFIENIAHVLQGRPLDYLVVNHMEPDHCANIEELLVRYPEMKIVGNAKTHNMIRQFYDADLEGKTITVKEGDTLALGKRTLHFFFAPMVHWPEVMVSWEETDKILFSADAFGSFGALNGNIFNDELNFDRGLAGGRPPLLYQHCWKIRTAGTECAEKAFGAGDSDDLPAARTDLAQRSGLPSGQV